jgi:hypothetical protein
MHHKGQDTHVTDNHYACQRKLLGVHVGSLLQQHYTRPWATKVPYADNSDIQLG